MTNFCFCLPVMVPLNVLQNLMNVFNSLFSKLFANPNPNPLTQVLYIQKNVSIDDLFLQHI